MNQFFASRVPVGVKHARDRVSTFLAQRKSAGVAGTVAIKPHPPIQQLLNPAWCCIHDLLNDRFVTQSRSGCDRIAPVGSQ